MWNFTKHQTLDFRLDYRIRTRCTQEIDNLCAAAKAEEEALSIDDVYNKKGGHVIKCLKENKGSIKGEACDLEVDRVIRVHEWSPLSSPVRDAMCKDDASKFCNTTKSGFDMNVCLRSNFKKLSSKCREVEQLQGSLVSGTWRLKPVIRQACKHIFKEYCSDEAKDERLKCVAETVLSSKKKLRTTDKTKRCRDLVYEDMKATMSDYRIMYGLTFPCMEDAEYVCPDVLYGDGDVMNCLATNRKQVRSEACQRDVRQYMKKAGAVFGTDKDTFNACKADAQSLCGGITPGSGRVHNCLSQHLSILEEECQEAEFEDLQRKSEDITLDADTMQLCKAPIQELCNNIESGEGLVWRCLEDNLWSKSMTADCRLKIRQHVALKNSNYGLNPAITQNCGDDLEFLCEDTPGAVFGKNGDSRAAIDCLVEERESINNVKCKSAILRKAVQRMEDIENDAPTYLACYDDIQSFCSYDTPPEYIHSCLQDNIESLSSQCQTREIEVMRQQSRNFLLNMKLQVCKASAQKYCKDLPWTKVIGCLLDVLHHKELPGDCKTALVDEQEKRSKSIDFNPTLADDCRADVDSLLYGGVCQDTTSDKGKGVKFEGRLIRCLLDHKEKVTRTDCKFAIVKIMQRQSNDWRANFNMVRACSPDVEFLCPDVTEGFGRVHECLRENFARVESQQCKQIVQSMNKTEHEDARINPRVHEKCDKDAKKFCRSTVPGHARLIICLSLHWNRDGFSADCKAALKSLNIDDKLAKVDKRNKEQAVIVQPFVAEMMDLLSRSSESWGVGGVLGSFLMLWAFGVLTVLSVLLVRRKCCGSSQAVVRHLAL